MKKLVQILAFVALSLSSRAGTPMTLEEAQRYAVENNIEIKIEEQTAASTRQDRVEAVAALFPSLSASSSVNNSYGRSIDPETNTYTTVGNVSNSYNLTTYLTVFSGLRNINALKASRLKMEMSGHSVAQKQDAVELNVMRLYFDALYYGESAKIVSEQKAAAEKVLELTTKQEELGVKSAADVALSASQVASYELLLTQQESLHSQALLNLKEAMNYPFDEELILSDNSSIESTTTATIFNIEANPEYQKAASQVEVSRTNLKIARGSYAPTLAVGAGYNNYYFTSLAEGYTPPTFTSQLKINYGYYIGASLSIPIFDNLSRRTTVARSRFALRTAQLELKRTQQRVSKAATEAMLNRNNSLKESQSAHAKVEASELANQAMQKRYKQGAASIIDLQTTSNELLKARAEELRARFNYLIECRIVEYYFNS
ncbi:MAG: TolC family protein [Rikenellaceae bacterium]